MSTTATDRRRALTPPAVAEILGVDADRVRAWIVRGELRGVDVSERPGVGRPRWRVLAEDLETFLAGRAAVAPPPKPRRRRKATRKYY